MAQPQPVGEPALSMDDIPVPDVSGLITEDDTPVDNLLSEKQMRLLTEPLYASWSPPDGRRFFLASNVGVFPMASNDPLVPDVFLSLDTAPKQPFHEKRNRSYFIWEHGKPPDVVIEVVSNTEGDELTRKLRGYERMRVSHYVVFDPWRMLGEAMLSRFELHSGVLIETPGALALPELDLGLVVWQGAFENETATWLRWCHKSGELIPTGAEAAATERTRADTERARADRLAEKLRALGVDPDDAK